MATFSQLDRLLACPGSATLPQANRSGGRAERGTAIHEFLEWYVTKGPTVALSHCSEKYNGQFDGDFEAINVHPLIQMARDKFALDNSIVKTELGVAINTETGDVREIPPRKAGNGYAINEGVEVAGTIDIAFQIENNAYVLDYKTGFQNTSPRTSMQLAAAALAVRALWRVETVLVGVVHVPDDKPMHIELLEFGQADAEATFEKLKQVLHPRRHDFAEGEHCKYCPAFLSCPKKQALALAVGGGDMRLPALTIATAPKILERLEAAEVVLESVRETLKAFASEFPFATEDGKRFGPYQHNQDEINESKAIECLTSAYGYDLASRAVKQTMNKTSIVSALKSHAKETGKTFAEVEREAFAMLREAGAVTKQTTTRIGKK